MFTKRTPTYRLGPVECQMGLTFKSFTDKEGNQFFTRMDHYYVKGIRLRGYVLVTLNDKGEVVGEVTRYYDLGPTITRPGRDIAFLLEKNGYAVEGT